MTAAPNRIHTLFDSWLQRNPQRVFLKLRGPDGEPATMTYAQVGELVDALQAELVADGVRSGDRVFVVAENCPQHLALILAHSTFSIPFATWMAAALAS